MLDLFLGLASAHGTHSEPEYDENSSKWAIKKTARTVREPVTPGLWAAHLRGERPLGVVCIREDSQCRWGAIDIDEYREDLISVVQRIEQRRLPLVPCRSKSGGLHLFLFLAEWRPAEKVQAVLRDVAASLGLAGSEIFPKQTQVKSDRGDVGNWIVMPYFGGDYDGKLKIQAGLKSTGSEMTIAEFITIAHQRRVQLEDVAACVKKATVARKEANGSGHGPFWDGPPCLQHLASIGVPAGGRNTTLFNMATYFKRKYPEAWRDKLDEANRTYLAEPLPSDEVEATKKMQERKTYEYQCKTEPLVSHCNSAKCRGCKFGIGNSANYPVIHSITRLNITPVTFFVDVPAGPLGSRLELSSDQLYSFSEFNRACLDQLNVMFTQLKAPEWTRLVNEALSSCEHADAPPDVGLDARFHEALEDFLTNRQRGERLEDLLTGRPYEDVEREAYYFRLRDLEDHLDRDNFRDDRGSRLTRPRMTKMIKKLGGGEHFFNIRVGRLSKGVRTWFVPSSAIVKTPDFEPQPARETI